MDEAARLLLSLAIAAVGLTVLGAGVIWSLDPERRLRRSLTKVLGETPHALLTAPARGRGVGFNFTTGELAVTWDIGAWCLVYRVEELLAAELLIEGQVLARVHRGEPRRALDNQSGAERRVTLRLLFDDPANPDFLLDLWLAEDAARRNALTSIEAVQEANRWIARIEAVFRRPSVRRLTPAPAVASPQPAPTIDGLPPWDPAEDEFGARLDEGGPDEALAPPGRTLV